jgi:hypothetical protein
MKQKMLALVVHMRLLALYARVRKGDTMVMCNSSRV